MKKLTLFLLFLFVVGMFSAAATAQTPSGTVDGTVRDESGAVIPGAEILLTNTRTNATRNAISNDEGRFRISNVASGDYRCEAKLTGFKTATADFKLDVAGLQTLNFTLQVGDISETVEVSSAVQKVNTEEGTLSSVVSGRQVEDLPLNGRNVFQLALLQPGVTAGINDGIGGQSGINASGNRTRGNNFSLDGVSNNDPITGGATSVTPNLDAVQEFRIQNNNFSAEFGRNNGAVINVITKSGTNEFHGTAYWFHRNNALDSREFFDGADTAPLRQHQAGFTIGGPVIKDKTFFFWSYEEIRTFSGESTQGRFETPELRQLAQQQAPNSLAAQFFQSFPGPTPTSGFADVGSISGQFQAAGPADGINDTGIASFFSPTSATSRQYNVRLDHEVSDNNKLFFRYMWQDSGTPSNNIRSPELGSDFDGHFANGVISDTHIFSPTVVNEVRFGYNRTRTDFATSRFDITDFNIFNFQGSDGISGFGAYGGLPQFFTAEEYHLVDVVSLNLGDHGVKAGFEYRWNQDDSDFQFLTRGYVTFDGVFDFISELPSEVSARVDPRVQGQLPLVGTPHNFRQSEWAFFIQDDWKVSDRLTLNLGLRYDNYGQVTEEQDRLSNIILGSGANVQERIFNAVVGQVDPDGVFGKDNNNFAPRLGFAYDLFGDGKTSLRGGFGAAYDRLFLNVTGNIRFNPPFSSNLGLYSERLAGNGISAQEWAEFLSSSVQVPFQLPSGITGLGFNAVGGPLLGVTFPGSSNTIQQGGRITLRSPDPSLRTSYSMNWFLGLQRELPNDMLLEFNYTGNAGRKLGFIDHYNRYPGARFGAPNPFTGTNTVFINDLFSSENLRTNNINSAYHGGNVSIQKRFSDGLAFQSAFTFGKAIDFGSDNFSSNAGSIFSVSPENFENEKGLASFDIRKRWVSNVIYELPFLKDRGGFVGNALGGWQVQAILTFQDGSPYTPQAFSSLHDYNGDFRSNDRPDAPSGGSDQFNDNDVHDFVNGVFGNSGQRALFNPGGVPCNRDGASTDRTSCTTPGLGTLGRSNFIGPGFKNIDFSLFKDFRVPWAGGEDARLQFRAEFFNITNRVNLTQPSRSFTSSFFGKSTGAFDAREIQFALKFIF